MKLQKHPYGRPYLHVPTQKKVYISQVMQDNLLDVHVLGVAGSSFTCTEDELEEYPWYLITKEKEDKDSIRAIINSPAKMDTYTYE